MNESVLFQIGQLLPGAMEYRRRMFPVEVSEGAAPRFPYTERHLHILWFDDSLRPAGMKTLRGEPVSVESPGRWNLEAGPDFKGAVLRVGREQRRLSGDVEIHVSPADWKNHGHFSDPRYDGVRFHVTWFGGVPDKKLFPPGTIHISLNSIPAADLESFDLTAYPYEEPRACGIFPLAEASPDTAVHLLESAGEARLFRKAERIAWLIKHYGAVQTLYEESAAVLGYKNNKVPFRKLARLLPVSSLEQYASDWETVYAVLLGVSGLLPLQAEAGWRTEVKAYFRSLWDCWWREQHKWDEIKPLNDEEWSFSGLRPLNHPVRRLCALAQWTAGGWFQSAADGHYIDPPLYDCFWTENIGWSGKKVQADLIGIGRMRTLELNVLVPFRLANGDSSAMNQLRGEPLNSVIRETAYTLFGPDHSPKLYRSALARQGLLQLFHDFVLSGKSGDLADAVK